MNPTSRKLIAALEIVGGAAGAIMVTIEVAQGRLPPEGLVIAAAVATLFLFTLFAGVMLWRDTRTGRVASVICQLVQLPKVVGASGAFCVSYALDFSVLALFRPGWWGVTFDVRFIGYYQFGTAPKVLTGFGISLTSCVVLSLLLRGRKRVIAPAEIGSHDAVAEFREAQQAIRNAKAEPVAPPEHPLLVPSRGMYLVFGLLLTIAVLVLSCCCLSSTLPPMPLGPNN